ncbi:hypothetical protein SmJEL517_g00697 [Synchytrium microbalum]|uniref:Uncharacterized protein n=1 Tax=Synchytrium microbalum TaxID=1806994 RepID=A0A507CEL5_9FUNG|nr:uncharacterized protein SmJEL517_g00697 [Synchytrium microbalum]TPX37629.1 hypothetical protein SmJEL517_g00697 [Synchytrium microbalum]
MADDLFDKIRHQTSSKLENQRQAALVLRAVEDTIKEQGEELVPLAYFGAMMTMLEQQQAVKATESEQEQLVIAVTYLLSFVFPRIPPAVFRAKLSDIATPLTATLESHVQNAPITRAVLTCIECLLLPQDLSSWSQPTCKSLFVTLLGIALDIRPKVRRRAQDGVRRLLSRPPPPSTLHPCTLTVIEYCQNLVNGISNGQEDKKSKEQAGLHLLGFLKSMLPIIAPQSSNDKTREAFEALSNSIINLAIKGSVTATPMMTQLVYDTFTALFPVLSDEEELLSIELADSILQSLMQVRPYQNDVVLTPAWLALVAQGLVCLSGKLRKIESDPASVEERAYATQGYPTLFASFFAKTFTPYLGSSSKPIVLEKTVEAFTHVIKNGVLESMLLDVGGGDDMETIDDESAIESVYSVIKLVNASLINARYRDAWGGILKLAQSIFERCGIRHFNLVRNTLIQIVSIRDDSSYASSFPFRAELEGALEHATRCFGTELFTSAVSLNVEKEDPSQPPRPYLLALFGKALPQRNATSAIAFGPPAIRFFVSHWIPFATRMIEKASDYKAKNRDLEYKLYETLAKQTWDLLPGICASRPRDAYDHFGKLGPTLGTILQTQPENVFANHPIAPDLRPVVCTSLSLLVEGFLELSSVSVDEEGHDPEQQRMLGVKQRATAGLTVLKNYAKRFLSVLCNNYTQVPPELLAAKAKGQALQEMHEKANQYYKAAISSFLKIVDSSVVDDHFLNVMKALLAMQSAGDASAQQIAKLRSYSMHDLLMMMLPHLSPDRVSEDSPFSLFHKFLLGELKETDTLLQKRVYRCISVQLDLATAPGRLDMKELSTKLMDTDVVANCASGSKKARLGCLGRIVEAIPVSEAPILLAFIPQVLGEVLLGTKEASEKARVASYECLVSMGRKMLECGQEDDDDTLWGDIGEEEDDEDMESAADADKAANAMETDDKPTAVRKLSFKEYLMMVVAGLTDSSAHMQSASISSLSRLLFEFKDFLSESIVKEILTAVLFFVESPQREVVKAALGFVKVAIVALAPEILEGHLEIIITAILKHSRDTRSHFRQKVRHIIERLIRRFSFEAVEGFIPEPDRKLLSNIRKRRERSKRQKAVERHNESAAGVLDDLDDDVLPTGSALAKSRASRQKEFEDVLHDSDSDLNSDNEDLDDYLPEALRDGSTQRGRKSGTSIREDQQDVLDFLDPQIVSRVSSTNAKRSKSTSKPSTSKSNNFSTSNDGRMVFADSDEEEAANAKPVAPDYYKQSREGESAFTRMADGRIKFAKFNKRKRDADDDDEEMEEGGGNAGSKRNNIGKKRGRGDSGRPFGSDYKAKHAGGDVKRKGKPDPYAYIPLNRKGAGKDTKKGGRPSSFKSILKPERPNRGEQKGHSKFGNKGHKRRF